MDPTQITEEGLGLALCGSGRRALTGGGGRAWPAIFGGWGACCFLVDILGLQTQLLCFLCISKINLFDTDFVCLVTAPMSLGVGCLWQFLRYQNNNTLAKYNLVIDKIPENIIFWSISHTPNLSIQESRVWWET